MPLKLEPFKPLIQARLTDFPALSGIRLFAECRAAGYTGGITQLRDYVRTLRPAPDPVVRYETPPRQHERITGVGCARISNSCASPGISTITTSAFACAGRIARRPKAKGQSGAADPLTA